MDVRIDIFLNSKDIDIGMDYVECAHGLIYMHIALPFLAF